MTSATRYLLLTAIVVLAGAALLLWRPWDRAPARSPAGDDLRARAGDVAQPMRPTRPPVRGRDRPVRAPEPKEPPGMLKLRAKTYAAARSAGHERPGDAAFRSTVDAYVEYNRKFAEAQARDEKITVEEVRELTYFGFLVMETQRWPAVEEILGRPLSDEERDLGEQLMHRFNSEFKQDMRALVQREADTEERWQLIRSTQENYKREYFTLTGMDGTQLDDLLAGDITRAHAPIATPPPDDIPVNPETPPEQAPQRPERSSSGQSSGDSS